MLEPVVENKRLSSPQLLWWEIGKSQASSFFKDFGTLEKVPHKIRWYQGNSSVEKRLDIINKALEKDTIAQVRSILTSIQDEVTGNPERIGKVLIVFTLFYVGGLKLGTLSRTHKWFDQIIERKVPWIENRNLQSPPTASDAVDWLILQEQLQRLGYKQEQIDNVYSIQVKEWDKTQKSENANSSSGNATSNSNENQPVASANQNASSQKPRKALSSKVKKAEDEGEIEVPTPTPPTGKFP